MTAMPKVVEAMRRVVIVVKRMVAGVYVLWCFEYRWCCQEAGVWFVVNKISRT